MAIENKPAEKYAKNGTSVASGEAAVTASGNGVDDIKMSVGNVFKKQIDGTKTDGIKQRGSGAATKGFTSRGPMA